MAGRGTTTEQGYGWQHQKALDRLKRTHRDGSPCWWCGEPMYLSQSLQGDHSVPRAKGGTVTDRLLHGPCNTERGDGGMDHVRPALTRTRRGGHAGNVLEWDT